MKPVSVESSSRSLADGAVTAKTSYRGAGLQATGDGAAKLLVLPLKMGPLSIDPRVAAALYCIVIALLVTLALLVDIASGGGHRPENRREPRARGQHRKK